ncbi:MAG: TonB-dependent siderophore receptor [Candidatus Binatia bacterium]
MSEIHAYRTEHPNSKNRSEPQLTVLPPGRNWSAGKCEPSRRRRNLAYLAALPAALLLAGAFPVLAAERELDPGRLKLLEGILKEVEAPALSPPPTLLVQESGEPPPKEAADQSPDRFQVAPTTVEASKEQDEGFKAETQSSATKSPLSIRETPQSISVVTQDLLDARQTVNLKQALETVAGVNQYSGTGPFAGTSAFGFQAFQIRGVATYGEFDLREDGLLGSPFYAQPDLAVYERIEVVKGPASVLSGRGSAGGFINRIRKTPLSEARAEVMASIGSFDHYRGDVDVTGPLFGWDRLRGRLVTAYEDADSFVDGVESAITVLAPGLEFDVTDSTRLRLLGLYQEQRFISNSGFPLMRDGDIFRAPKVRRSLFFGVPNEDRDDNNWEILSGSAQLDQDIGDNWLATLKMNWTVTDQPIDQDNYAYVYSFDEFSNTGNVGLYSSAFDAENDILSGEMRLAGSLDLVGRPVNLAVGADHSRTTVERLDTFVSLGTANIYEQNFADFPTVQPTTPTFNSDTQSESTGVYTELSFRPFQRLNILMSGRHDWADSSDRNKLVPGSKSEKKDRKWSGRFGLVFDLLPHLSVYALYAQSFTPQPFDTDEDGNILDPETGEIYEGGIKTEWFDSRLGINAAVFRLERDNVGIPALGVDNNFSVAAGLQRSDGVELEVKGEPFPGWRVSLGASLLDSRFVEKDDPFHGSRPGGTADWQVGFYTSYELQHGPLKGLGVGASLFAIGERGVSEFVPDANLQGYERVDLYLFYSGFRHFDIKLQVRNVLDEKYVEGADRPGAYALFGSPTAVLLQVRYEF